MSTPLTSVQNVKIALGIPDADTTFNKQFGQWINQATAAILKYCNVTDFSEPDTYTEILDGNDGPALALHNLPVLGITSLYLDNGAYGGDASGAFASSTLQTQGTNYYLDWDGGPGTQSSSGLVFAIGQWWPKAYSWVQGLVLPYPVASGGGNIKVTYTAGITAPPDVEWACQTMVARMRQIALYGQQPGSQSQSGVSVSMPETKWFGLINAEIASALAGYRNVAL